MSRLELRVLSSGVVVGRLSISYLGAVRLDVELLSMVVELEEGPKENGYPLSTR